MRIVNIGPGRKIKYLFEGTVVKIEGGWEFDLLKLQDAEPVHIDISIDKTGDMVFGPSFRYLAQIDIPGKVFVIEKTGEADDMGIPKVIKREIPFHADDAILYLWPTENQDEPF